MDKPTEHWLSVVGHEGLYEVSDQGRVRSLDRMVRTRGAGMRHVAARMLKLDSSTGYATVEIAGRTRRVHQLVAAAFLGPCPPGLEVCHNDGNSRDSRVSNLRYDTHSANLLDAVAQGTHHNASKTHCPQGHEYTSENTRYHDYRPGKRVCIICFREVARINYHRRKAKERQPC